MMDPLEDQVNEVRIKIEPVDSKPIVYFNIKCEEELNIEPITESESQITVDGNELMVQKSKKRKCYGKTSYGDDQGGKKFINECRVELHRVILTGEKIHHCDKCDAAFVHKINLTRHHNIHTKEYEAKHEKSLDEIYECYECDETFSRIAHLKEHMNRHASASAESFDCERCGQEFTRNDSLMKHIAMMHTDTADETDDTMTESNENVCGRPDSLNINETVPNAVSSNRFLSTKAQLDRLDNYMMTEVDWDTEADKDDKWNELTIELNRLGPRRPTEKWRKIWTARKYNLKKRAAFRQPEQDIPKQAHVRPTIAQTHDFIEPKKAMIEANIQQQAQKPDSCGCSSTFFPLILDKLDALTGEIRKTNGLLGKLLQK